MQSLTLIIGVILGLFAKPLQDWFYLLITKKQRDKEAKKDTIKKAFFFTQNIKDHLIELDSFVGFFMMYNKFVELADSSKIPSNFLKDKLSEIPAPDQNAIRELKYIFSFELREGEHFVSRLDELLNNIFLIKQLAVSRQKELINPDPNFSQIQELLKFFNNDPAEAASTLSTRIEKEAKTLITDIEIFLKTENEKI